MVLYFSFEHIGKTEEPSLPDLKDQSLIISRASEPYFTGTDTLAGMNIVATYKLIYNSLGLALCFDSILNTTGDSPLSFRPLTPEIRVTGSLIWKKYQVFSPVVQVFIEKIKKMNQIQPRAMYSS